MTATNIALGHFLRTRRERLSPEALGSSSGRRRRTPGLRREEVAEAAGISGEWYVKLEQGRAVAPSLTTVGALARALRLDDVEHAHLRRLARGHDNGTFVPEVVPGTIRRLVESLPNPAYVMGRRWDLLAWNASAVDVFSDFGAMGVEDRNILLYILTNPRGRILFGPRWEAEAQRMVALFRATHDLWAADQAFVDIIARLRSGCAEFDGWWKDHAVREPVSGEKKLYTIRGVRRFEYATFQANDDPALKLAIYVPVT